MARKYSDEARAAALELRTRLERDIAEGRFESSVADVRSSGSGRFTRHAVGPGTTRGA